MVQIKFKSTVVVISFLFAWNLFEERKLKMQLNIVNDSKKIEMLKVLFMVYT
jgi:hypothetical protein